MNPTQEPQEKKGEQPWHSFSLEDVFPESSFFAADFSWHCLSAQHGFAESKSTQKENKKQRNFTRQR